jgi:predicted esterase YcpF (UPF0227 family)
MIFYVHGFNSSRDSSTGRMLREQIGRPVKCLGYDCSKPFKENLEELGKEAWQAMDGFDVIVGSSLGGFYACEMAKDLQTCAVVFNPAMKPKSQLKQFLGENVNFATGEKWMFTDDILNSYPEELKAPSGLPVKAYASRKDEVLPGNGELVFEAFNDFEWMDSGHRVADFRKYLDEIKKYENILGVSPDE